MIKKRERFFELPDGTFFIIPGSWMTTYKQFSQFASVDNQNQIKLPKSNFKILEKLPTVQDREIITKDLPKYTSSTTLRATLRPYQKQGVQWLINLYHQKLGGCLADDMGLGKTLQTIAFLNYVKEQLEPDQTQTPVTLDLFNTPLEHKTYLGALLVMPSSLIFNWYQELQKFAPHLTIANYTGPHRKKLAPYLDYYDIILTTYHTAVRDLTQLKKKQFRCFVADESQQLKNKDSKLFQALHSLEIPHKISLSGTPIENSLSDLWSQMQFINPNILGSYPFFKKYFRIPIEKQQNAERIQELKILLAPFILRRTKEQVAKDLPQLSEQIIYTEMLPKQEKLYEQEKSAARNQLLHIGTHHHPISKINIINTLTKLRQISNHPQLIEAGRELPSGKFQNVTAYLQTLLKANKKILVFSSFVQHLECYTEWSRVEQVGYRLLTGKTKSEDRAKAVSDFQENPEVSLFFISIKAGGTGLNLTSASYVVLLDPWWNPFVEQQAIARAHRIGQTDHVTVTKFITKNTVEEKIIQLQERKKLLSDEIIAIDAIPELDQSTLKEILQ